MCAVWCVKLTSVKRREKAIPSTAAVLQPSTVRPLGADMQRSSSPSQRAREDQARMRARQGKYGLNPGPGTYDPRRPSSTKEDIAGSSAFKSKSDRKVDQSLREVGDPGSYNPYDAMTVGAQSTRSFNRSASTGAGGFGTKTQRAQLSTPNDAPGPGTYDARLPQASEAKQGSAFASQTKRGAYLRKQTTPGAGEYDPSLRDKIGGGDSMFRSRDERFKKSMELEYAAHVGPGSYSSHDHLSVAAKSRKARGKASPAFASTSLRGDLFMGGP